MGKGLSPHPSDLLPPPSSENRTIRTISFVISQTGVQLAHPEHFSLPTLGPGENGDQWCPLLSEAHSKELTAQGRPGQGAWAEGPGQGHSSREVQAGCSITFSVLENRINSSGWGRGGQR